MVEVKKGEKETIGSLVRRFSRAIKQSGILLEVRKRQFYRKSKNRNQKRRKALRRIELQAEYEKLKKIGRT